MSDILRELALAKVVFQLRAIEAVIYAGAIAGDARSGETTQIGSTGTASTRAEGIAHPQQPYPRTS